MRASAQSPSQRVASLSPSSEDSCNCPKFQFRQISRAELLQVASELLSFCSFVSEFEPGQRQIVHLFTPLFIRDLCCCSVSVQIRGRVYPTTVPLLVCSFSASTRCKASFNRSITPASSLLNLAWGLLPLLCFPSLCVQHRISTSGPAISFRSVHTLIDQVQRPMSIFS
jgi:hypothetical protein